MKKLIQTAFVYALLALAGGVFYREFTKFSGFSGNTVLADLHVHLFILGMFLFLIVASLEKSLRVTSQKRFQLFYWLYNAGLLVTAAMLLTRGVTQVNHLSLSFSQDAALSGVAGIGHILLTAGLLALFSCLRAGANMART